MRINNSAKSRVSTLAIQLFRIFTACFYFLDADNRATYKSMAITSELPDCSRAAAISCVKSHGTLERKTAFTLINAIIWSECCRVQFS